MTDDSVHADVSCEEFQQNLPVLVEAGEELYRHPHLKSCALCRSLVIDLEKIAIDAGKLTGPEN